jgi:hypothetical protein
MSQPDRFGSTPQTLPRALEARLEAALSAELSRSPPAPWGRDAAIFLSVTVGLFAAGAFIFNKAVSPFAVGAAIWAQALTLLGVALISGVAALAPWPQRTRRPVLLGGLLGSAVVVTQAFSMELSAFTPKLGCFVWELCCSFIPAGLALLAVRQHAPRLSRALVMGWAAGTTSLAVMQLKCPHRDLGHVVIFHLAPLGLVVLATVLVRRRLSTSSYAP